MTIHFIKLSPLAHIPTRESASAAGYDLYASIPEPMLILPHTTMKIPTNIAMEIPDGYFGAVYARSGIASKRGLRPANCVGVIDSDYRGDIQIALHNDFDQSQIVEVNERIAQIVIQPCLDVEFVEKGKLNQTARGAGGFGSTGNTQ